MQARKGIKGVVGAGHERPRGHWTPQKQRAEARGGKAELRGTEVEVTTRRRLL